MQITTQAQFDKLPASFKEYTRIEITGSLTRIDHTPTNGYIVVYGNATIEYVSGSATIEYVYGSATIKYVSDNATIESVSDSATIKYVSDNATIESVYGSATIEYVSDNATIKYVSDNATIKSVYGNATIKSVYGSASIELITGLAIICFLHTAKKVIAKGYATIRQIGTAKLNITKDKTVTFIQIDAKTCENTPDFDTYKMHYPVDVKGKKVILYKAMHKIGNEYVSDYDKFFKYEIGQTVKLDTDPSTNNSCSYGLHVSHFFWAKQFGRGWADIAILECEVPINKIVVSTDCDGKVRTSELKVIREVEC